MAKKFRRRPFFPTRQGIHDHDAIGLIHIVDGEESFIEWYDKDIHITRSIDERLSRKSSRWRSLPKEQRYKIIHQALGVQGIFDLIAFEKRQGIK